MKKLPLILFFIFGITSLHAQQVAYRNVVTVDINELQYPNTAGNTTSSQPQLGTVTLKDGSALKGKITFFKKKGVFERVKVNTGEEKREVAADQIASIALDPKIYEGKYANNFKNPVKNFQPGYIVLPDGERVKGKVAQMRDFTDYEFFIYTILFLPEGSATASAFKGGRLSEFGQEVDGKLQIWDGYVDGYLLRQVDGRFRLSRNPYSQTKNEFFTAVKNQIADSLSKDAARATLASSLNNGQDINVSLENAVNAGTVVGEVLGSVEINRKEYLIFDSRDKSLIVVNKDTFREKAAQLISTCKASVSAVSWDNVEGFIKELNAACQ